MEFLVKIIFTIMGSLTILYNLSVIVPNFKSQENAKHFLTLIVVTSCLVVLNQTQLKDVLLFYFFIILLVKWFYHGSTFIASLTALFVYLIQVLSSMITSSISVLFFNKVVDFRIIYTENDYRVILVQVLVVGFMTIYYQRIMSIFKKITNLNTRIERLLIVSNIFVFSLILAYQKLTFVNLVKIASSNNLHSVESTSVQFFLTSSYLMMTLLALLVVVLINRLCIVDNNMETYKYKAETDLMTGVLSREAGLSHLKNEMMHAAVNGMDLTVAYIDINDLKLVNDQYGHKEGDRMITKITEVIQASLRERDAIARLGGDEFMVVFKKCNASQARRVWARINESFVAVNSENHFKFKVSVSVGFSEYHVKKHQNIMHLIHEADAEMYAHKKQLKSARL